jgi:hypothetical protein
MPGMTLKENYSFKEAFEKSRKQSIRTLPEIELMLK